MSDEQLKAFLEAIKADSTLRMRLQAADHLDQVEAIASEAGYRLSKEALHMLQGPIPEEDLEHFVGATFVEASTVYLCGAQDITNQCTKGPNPYWDC